MIAWYHLRNDLFLVHYLMSMHRKLILAIILLFCIAMFAFRYQYLAPGPILEVLGILVVFSFVVSPFILYYCLKDLVKEGFNYSTLFYGLSALVLSIVFAFVNWRLWPQLMAI